MHVKGCFSWSLETWARSEVTVGGLACFIGTYYVYMLVDTKAHLESPRTQIGYMLSRAFCQLVVMNVVYCCLVADATQIHWQKQMPRPLAEGMTLMQDFWPILAHKSGQRREDLGEAHAREAFIGDSYNHVGR